MIQRKDTEAQLLVWQLKEEAWKEVEHLPLDEALTERLRRSAETTKAMGLNLKTSDPRKLRRQ